MKRLVKFEIHEYMDEYPTEDVKEWEGVTENEIAEKCHEFVEYMNSNYSGGITTFKGIMGKEEARWWIFDEIRRVIKRYHNDDAVNHIQRICEIYNQAYND